MYPVDVNEAITINANVFIMASRVVKDAFEAR